MSGSAQTTRMKPDQFAARMQGGTFLVVDDISAMRKITVNQLKQLGAVNLLEAGNGQDALRILECQPVTVILSDWNMPVMGGLELLQQVRAHPRLRGLPFLMITAEAERERVTAALQANVTELLVKPYTSARLADRIEKCLTWQSRHRGRAAAPGAMPSNPSIPETSEDLLDLQLQALLDELGSPVRTGKRGDRPTILVVDDTPDNLELLSGMFKDDYRVRAANSGEKALDICQTDDPPDLVLLDIMMPGMDGFEVARRLREHPSSETIPVIFVTALTDETSRAKGLQLGAVDFVTKPIDPVPLKLRVQNFLRYVELHKQLQADFDEMMANTRLREDVDSMTRHDIKAPLAGVLGVVQALSEAPNLTIEQRDLLVAAEEAAMQTLNMINLTNELYKIETGRYTLNPKPIPVVQVLHRVVKLQRKTFATKDLHFKIDLPDGLNDHAAMAQGDPLLCYSIFQNLLKNACEAAPAGSEITVVIVPGRDENPLTVSIENTGAVSADVRETFWEKFASAGKPGGSGIGTYSASLLAKAQQGNIEMETSDEKNRTTLRVFLPAGKS